MTTPIVMTISGHDPVGGAGVSADIEAIGSHGCHAVSVITCITVQDTQDVYRVEPLPDYLILQQAEALMPDMNISAIKVGLLHTVEAVKAVRTLIREAPQNIPIVLDPSLSVGIGRQGSPEVEHAICTDLLPLVTLLTLNNHELARLAQLPAANAQEQAQALLDYGCKAILVTGANEPTVQLENALYQEGELTKVWAWERLPHHYSGSGCTLTAACAALLAQGTDLMQALMQAQSYTWNTLEAGRAIGQGFRVPNRLYWLPPAV
ncbi:bifunctional hydroxymethylpyrimidine kinase/phosphomethylpyrimidine kinase [Thiofilum flexile]|uniref:bifunctional hydroxymethylpyrimidine kinase/phosphomethylpyrimidine kinase n=1 Tax=Thiofilum flexile TaxID=125627 RepID=UPI000373D0E4|nr:hydroxymethylpyrimidine/phosphomethylpyrimidine kinase [Thiofilum flexile]